MLHEVARGGHWFLKGFEVERPEDATPLGKFHFKIRYMIKRLARHFILTVAAIYHKVKIFDFLLIFAEITRCRGRGHGRGCKSETAKHFDENHHFQ